MDARSHDPGASAPPVLLPKHIIFLSHSGQEKAFVQELNQSLLLVNHSPFFDQNEDSLPKGERFPELIFQAARQCRVAVIVLSPGYLKSKWPMLELVEFHQSMKDGNPIKLLPVFYKLKPDQIESPEWTEAWVELFKQDEELVKKCKDAVHALKAINGSIFEGKDHIKYKKDVVEKICKLWPPPVLFDTSDMQGCDRLCKHISELFKEHNGIYYLGIYGIYGSGKSKQCQAMFNYYFEEYAGKVYIVDLEYNKVPENRAKKEREERLKAVIQKLVGSNQIMSDINSEEQLRKYFKDRVPHQCVFLVVENVSQSSIEEAEFYVKVGYAHGSRVLVTSENRSILEKVFGGQRYNDFCQPVPVLEYIEAIQLVLEVGAPGRSIQYLNDRELDIISEYCAKFRYDEQYHPSSLIAIARYFRRTVDSHEIANWNIEIPRGAHDVLRDVFRHVLLEYDKNLNFTAKLIFLDLALCNESKLYTYMDLRPGWQWDENTNFTNAIRYISYLHVLSFEHAQTKVKELQEMSFLKESTVEVAVPDFFKRFAYWLVTQDDRKESEWYLMGMNANMMAGIQIELVTRRLLIDGSMPGGGLKFQELTKLVYLELVRVGELEELKLQGLSSLRVMNVKDCKDLKEIACICGIFWDYINIRTRRSGCLRNLRLVQLVDLPNLENTSFAPHCTNLESLWIYNCPKVSKIWSIFGNYSLKRLALPSGFSDKNDFELEVFESLDDLTELVCQRGPQGVMKEAKYFLRAIMKKTSLEVLHIADVIPASMSNFKSIDVSKLDRLTILDLSGVKMTIIEELCKLWNLRALGLYGCSELLGLPDLHIFTLLEYLCISHCNKLVESFSKEDVPHRVKNFHALGGECNFDDHECLNPGW